MATPVGDQNGDLVRRYEHTYTSTGTLIQTLSNIISSASVAWPEARASDRSSFHSEQLRQGNTRHAFNNLFVNGWSV